MRKACGWRTIARPIATRWRWPPESARGLRFEEGLEAEDLRRLLHALVDLRLLLAAQLEPEGDVVVDRQVRVERVALEDHRDVAVARGTWFTTRSPILSTPSEMSSRPATIRSAVVFPHPDGPTRTMNSPSSISMSRSETALVPSG